MHHLVHITALKKNVIRTVDLRATPGMPPQLDQLHCSYYPFLAQHEVLRYHLPCPVQRELLRYPISQCPPLWPSSLRPHHFSLTELFVCCRHSLPHLPPFLPANYVYMQYDYPQLSLQKRQAGHMKGTEDHSEVCCALKV